MLTAASFGEWLKYRRKLLDLTQEALAKEVGCSLSAIRKMESDLRKPSRQIASLLAAALQVPDVYLADFTRMARGEWRIERMMDLLQAGTGAAISAKTERTVSTIPQPATPLIGRSPELSQVLRLLRSNECRLLNLFGPGGVGKTRLAAEVAQMVKSSFPDGVAYISLASVASPELIATAIGQAMGMSFFGSDGPEKQLLEMLQAKKMLLILDNCEQVIQGIRIVTQILSQTPNVKILTTSQQRLGLQGEFTFELSGLPVPPQGKPQTSEEYSSVRLFFENAQRMNPSFQITVEDRPWIDQICRATEGFPLAIELAASWVRMLSCEEIAHEIERSMDFLAIDRADIPERHRSMRAVFDRTWELLQPDDRAIFARLSVFRGGFRREAAEHICGARLAVLSRLIDQSLLHKVSPRRYEVHENLRSYALEKLKQDPELFIETRDRHTSFYSAWMASLEEVAHGPGQLQALEDIDAEVDNIRIAWEWAITHSRYSEIQQILPSLSWFYEMRGRFQEGAAAFQKAVDLFCVGRSGECMAEDAAHFGEHTIALGRLLTYYGFFLLRIGEAQQAKEMFLQSLGWIGPIRHFVGLADALRGMAQVAAVQENYAAALDYYQESMAVGRQIRYDWNTATCLVAMGNVEMATGHLSDAENRFQEAISIWRSIGDSRGLGFALASQGSFFLRNGKIDQAKLAFDEAHEISRVINDPDLSGQVHWQQGNLTCLEEKYQEAKELLLESERLFAGIGNKREQTSVRISLGYLNLFAGEHALAEEYFMDSLLKGHDFASNEICAYAILGLAAVRMQRGDLETALEICRFLASQESIRPLVKAAPWSSDPMLSPFLEDRIVGTDLPVLSIEDFIQSILQSKDQVLPSSDPVIAESAGVERP